MSNAGQAILTIGGTIVGAYFGNPQLGMMLGSLAGNALFPTDLGTVTGPRLNDNALQVSTVGAPIPLVYGTYALSGNVIWSSGIIETVSKKQQGGKGGPTQTIKTYSYKINAAIGICEGPIGGILRIWADSVLVYDARPQQELESDFMYETRLSNNARFAANSEIYLGDEDQLPDPTIQSFEGAGNVPAFRGLAYVVLSDFMLTNYGNRLPSFRFEVTNVIVRRPLWDSAKGVYLGREYVINEFIRYDNLSGAHFNVHLNPSGKPFLNVLVSTWEGSGVTAVKKVLRFRTLGLYDEYGDYYFDIRTLEPFGAMVLDGDNGFPTWFAQTDIPVGVTYAFNGFYAYVVNGTVGTVYRNDLEPQYDISASEYPGGEYSQGVGISPKGIDFSTDGTKLIITDSEAYPTDFGVQVGAFYTYELGIPFVASSVVGFGTRAEFGNIPTHPDYYSTSTSRAIPLGLAFSPDGLNVYVPWYPRGIEWYVLSAPFDVTTAQLRSRGGVQFPVGTEVIDMGWHYTGTHYWVLDNDTKSIREYWLADPVTPDKIELGVIVEDLSRRCGLRLDQIDTSELTELVDGYAVTRPMSGRDAIAPLRSYGFFDCVESGGKLTWPKRGKAGVFAFTDEDLAAHASGDRRPSLVETTRKQEVELPRRLRVHYAQTVNNYEAGEQGASRLAAGLADVRDIELAVAMGDAKAAQIAEVLLYEQWVARNSYQATVDSSWLHLEPADAGTMPIDGRVERVRIINIDHSLPGLLRLELVRDDDGTYVSTAVGAASSGSAAGAAGGGGSIPVIGTPDLVLLDLPALTDAHDEAGYYAALRATDSTIFGGAVLLRSADGGTIYTEVGTLFTEATMGTVDTALPAGPTTIIDYGNELWVTLPDAAELESVSEASLLAGANAAAIGDDGRWEIVQFMDAEPIGSPVQWRLTGLLRGRRGTEWAVGTSEIGDRFVLLDAALIRVPLNNASIGAERLLKPVLAGATIEETAAEAFTGRGVALKPFAPVHVAGSWTLGGDLEITWIRRGRIGQELPDGADIPLSEASEAYELEVLDGAGTTVLRAISAATAAVTYTDAQQLADFGSAPDAVNVRVYQLSAVVGRGYATATTFTKPVPYVPVTDPKPGRLRVTGQLPLIGQTWSAAPGSAAALRLIPQTPTAVNSGARYASPTTRTLRTAAQTPTVKQTWSATPAFGAVRVVPQTPTVEYTGSIDPTAGALRTVGQQYVPPMDDIRTASFVRRNDYTADGGAFMVPVAFNPSGTKLFVVTSTGGVWQLRQYTLSTPWDMTTATYDGVAVHKDTVSPALLSATFQGHTIFSADGTKVYTYVASSTWAQIDLAAPWDLAAPSNPEKSYDFTPTVGTVRGIAARPGETTLYAVDSAGTVYQFTLTTAGDISTAEYTGDSFTAAADTVSVAQALQFDAAGVKLFVLCGNTYRIYEHALSTAWDITTASYADSYAGIGFQQPNPTNFVFFDGYTRMLLGGTGWSADVKSFLYEYTLAPTRTADAQHMYVVTDTGDWIMQYALAEAWDLKTGVEIGRFSTGVEDTTPLGLGLSPDGVSLFVLGSVGDRVYQYTLNTPYDIRSAVYTGNSLLVSGQNTDMRGLYVRDDGLRMWTISNSGSTIYEYAFGTPFDITTASYTGVSKSVSAQGTGLQEVWFREDGRKMYTTRAGTSINQVVYQYSLPVAWDVSSAVYDSKSRNINTASISPRSAVLNLDGTRMFVCGNNERRLRHYDLSKPWDISTGTIIGPVDGGYLNAASLALTALKFVNPFGTATPTYNELRLDGQVPVVNVSGAGILRIVTQTPTASNSGARLASPLVRTVRLVGQQPLPVLPTRGILRLVGQQPPSLVPGTRTVRLVGQVPTVVSS